jgi:hypothetical protein
VKVLKSLIIKIIQAHFWIDFSPRKPAIEASPNARLNGIVARQFAV